MSPTIAGALLITFGLLRVASAYRQAADAQERLAAVAEREYERTVKIDAACYSGTNVVNIVPPAAGDGS